MAAFCTTQVSVAIIGLIPPGLILMLISCVLLVLLIHNIAMNGAMVFLSAA